ncbi:hypothetical protein ROHU_025930 [Labeo rohita]|uniref:Uncharacterized protein n=1 Tax=Labeo rohita TaxID=84645 RepID=A0A498MPB0_LABRO|nr:hypothetical protein ROHU_025930 [Labeo rohita]
MEGQKPTSVITSNQDPIPGCIREILGATLHADRMNHIDLDPSSELPSRLTHQKPDHSHIDLLIHNRNPPRTGCPLPLQNIHHCRTAQPNETE